MADENKLLGTLELSTGTVFTTIDQVNSKLKTLGQGISLDLTNAVNTAVQNLNQAITNLNNAHPNNGGTSGSPSGGANPGGASNNGNSQNAQLRETVGLMTDIANTQTRIANSRSEAATQHMTGTQNRLNGELTTNQQLLAQASQTRQVRNAQERATVAGLMHDERELLRIDQLRQAEADRVQQRNNASRAAVYTEEWKRQLDERDAYNKYLEEEAKYYDNVDRVGDQWDSQQLNKAISVKQQIIETETAMASLDPEKDAQQLQAYETHLKGLTDQYGQFNDVTRQQAENSQKITEAYSKQEEAMARQKDSEHRAAVEYVGRGAERGVMQVGRWSMGIISEQFGNAVDFAKEYDGYMTEIQMVTLKTEQQMDNVSEGLQRTAAELGVSLTDVASAAVTFYRMGFSDTEVQDRQLWVTKFAKVANVDFTTAAKMMVTVSNSMSKDIQGDLQRVSDVLLYLGDNSATTAADVAQAMETLGPVAQAVGIPFEQIATMTAALSDSTQQSASRIGTGLRTLIMRLYAVRNTQIEVFKDFAEDGEMEELWEIKNDPAKLMQQFKEAGIELQNTNGQWRDFYSILSDIAALWSTLDTNDPKRSALMTILGGQRGGTYISALLDTMNPNTGKYYELYQGLTESYGSTEQKYSIWTESAAAAQERQNLALQQLYSTLDVSVVVEFYEAMAMIASNTATATKNLGGMNFVIPALVAGYTALSLAATKAGMSTLTFGNILTVVRTAMANHPILAAATIFLTLATTVSVAAGAIFNAIEETRKAQIRQYNEAIDMATAAQRKAQTFVDLKDKMNEMFVSSEDVTLEFEKYNSTLESLTKISPMAAFVVDQLKQGMIDQKEAARLLNAELDNVIEREQKLAATDYQTALQNKTISESTANMHGQENYDEWYETLEMRSSEYKKLIDPERTIESLQEIQKYFEDALSSSGTPDNRAKFELGRAISLLSQDSPYEGDEMWNWIAASVWDVLNSGNFHGDRYQGQLEQERDDWVRLALKAAGLFDLPDFLQNAFVEQLTDIIDGSNDVLEKSDFSDAMRDELFQYVERLFANTWNKSSSDIIAKGVLSNQQIMDSIYDQIFGAGAAKAEGKQWTQSDEQVQAIAQTYENLIEMGFSNADLQEAMESIGENLWDNPDLFNIFQDFDTNQIQNTKKLIQDLGWSFVDFYRVLSNKNNSAEFLDFLENTNNQFTRLSANAGKDNLLRTFYLLQNVSKNIQNGQPLDDTTLASLTQGTPWLLQSALSGDRASIQKTMTDIALLIDQILYDEAEALYKQAQSAGKKIEGSKADYIKIKQEQLRAEAYNSYRDIFDKKESQTVSPNAEEEPHMEYTSTSEGGLQIDVSGIGAAQQKIDELTASLNAGAEATQQFGSTYNSMFGQLQSDEASVAELQDGLMANIFAAYETSFPELKQYAEDYGRGSEEYMQRLNELWGQNVELVDEAGEAYEDIGEEIGNLGRGTSTLLPLTGVRIAGAGMSDVGGLGIPKPQSQEELSAYASTVLSLISYSAALSQSVEDTKNKTSGYWNEMTVLANAYAEEGIVAAVKAWQSFDDATKNTLASTYPMLIAALGEVAFSLGADADAVKNLEDAFEDASFKKSARYFSATANSLDKLSLHTMNAVDAYVAFNQESEKTVKAQTQYLTAVDKTANGLELTSADVKELADYLGFVTPEALLQNWDQVGPMLSSAVDEGTEALNRLNEAAFINITGVSSADFSDIMNGLIAVQDEADATVQSLLRTGQWELVEQNVEQDMPVWMMGGDLGSGGHWVMQHATGTYRILKPTGSNPFKSAKSSYKRSNAGASSGGGGGGGGGGSKGMTEVERMLDRMAQIQAIQNHTKSLFSAEASYYAQTGQLQGVIQYYEKERDAIKRQNETLRANLDEMEPWLEKKKAEVAALKVTDAQYEEAASDLKALQERHQEYTLALINNESEIDKLTESIKQQRDAIRQMEIDLRNTILDAIKDREALNDRILQGTVDTENTILDLIKKRYEKERDMIIENSERQIEALQKERDLLDEQLQKRKELAEEEDKAAKLAELEAKYVRIAADPTRQKEAMSIQKEINDLRDEMAWDLAEKEVEAQQESIDQQIESLEDYVKYIENYYEYLFEHPQQLIDEMREIIKGTDEEIIAWLQANDEEYAKSTAATQETMVNGWHDTLMNMRGELELYWDEVEQIIAGGDDYIVNFLMENSAKYREAGKLQAEAYVDEWREQLADLHKAYQAVAADAAAYAYTYIAPFEGNNSGGGGGGGGPTTTHQTVKKASDLLSMADITQKSLETGYGPIDTDKKWADTGNHFVNVDDFAVQNKAKGSSSHLSTDRVSFLPRFATGGVATSDGVAYVEGKERILTPYQTTLFDSLVRAMDTISHAYIPSMPVLGADVAGNGNPPINVGDIIVNVDKMDTDADYEDMAEKVFNALMERINRGNVVGGIRYAY